jgi:hypothetical protein
MSCLGKDLGINGYRVMSLVYVIQGAVEFGAGVVIIGCRWQQ